MRITLHPENRFQQEIIRRFLLQAIESQAKREGEEVLKNLTDEESKSLSEMLSELKRAIM
jgi:hypothetical protein